MTQSWPNRLYCLASGHYALQSRTYADYILNLWSLLIHHTISSLWKVLQFHHTCFYICYRRYVVIWAVSNTGWYNKLHLFFIHIVTWDWDKPCGKDIFHDDFPFPIIETWWTMSPDITYCPCVEKARFTIVRTRRRFLNILPYWFCVQGSILSSHLANYLLWWNMFPTKISIQPGYRFIIEWQCLYLWIVSIKLLTG